MLGVLSGLSEYWICFDMRGKGSKKAKKNLGSSMDGPLGLDVLSNQKILKGIYDIRTIY